MNSPNRSLVLPRRRLLTSGARLVGAFSLGSVAGLLADGCARQPKVSTDLGQRLLNVQFTVAGSIASASPSTPFYYLAVINLTDDESDAGPVPISGTPIGNGIAAPSIATSNPTQYQTFVGYILYSTGTSQYEVYVPPKITSGSTTVFETAPTVPSYSGFTLLGIPDTYVVPNVDGPASTFNATIDLNRLKPTTDATLGRYAQVNVITYNYLASSDGYNGTHYYDAIGNGTRTSNDYAVLDTTTTGRVISSDNFVDMQGAVMNQYGQAVTAATDPTVVNLQIVSWSVVILAK